MTAPSPMVAQPPADSPHWRYFDNHWSYYHPADKRWYYTDGSHWYYNENNAWRVYNWDHDFGRERFVGARKIAPAHDALDRQIRRDGDGWHLTFSYRSYAARAA